MNQAGLGQQCGHVDCKCSITIIKIETDDTSVSNTQDTLTKCRARTSAAYVRTTQEISTSTKKN